MRWPSILVVLALFTGCTRKLMTDDERKADYAQGIKPVIAKYQASVIATIASLESIPKAGATEPRVTAVQPLPAPVACNYDTCLVKTVGSASRISVENTPSLIDFSKVPRILRGEYEEYASWQADQQMLEKIDAISHYAIVRVHEYEKPVPGSTADRYTGGHAAGDAIIYDVKTGKRIGAVTWTAEMPETVHIPGDATDPAAEYESQFVGHAGPQITEALENFYAGKGAVAKPVYDDDKLRERQIMTLLVQDAEIMVVDVVITDGAACKVVLTGAKALIAANPEADDGAVKPKAAEIVRKVMGKADCAVTYTAF